ncbi:MAG TPA: hypothetical protein VFV95_00280 [Vicinamibacterales bacterium]|nr:hypothetical protein [Vicinamibacterales bacterium]
MTARVKLAAVALFAAASVSAAPAPQTYTGVVSDDICAKNGHAKMQMGPTDAACTKACVLLHGAAYVLQDGKNIYPLSDQKKPEEFAGQKVKIVGSLDAKTKAIHIDSIAAVK